MGMQKKHIQGRPNTNMNRKNSEARKYLWRGIMSGITSMGLLYPAKFSPPRYSRSFKDDQEAIAEDMWKAFVQEHTANHYTAEGLEEAAAKMCKAIEKTQAKQR